MNKISIVLATYNGGKYLNEQLDSIYASEGLDSLVDEIVISDDNSTDNTLEIINSYMGKQPKIRLVKNSRKGGVISNFMHGLSFAKNDLIMFCDQDDVWLPNKIKSMHSEIVSMESSFSKDIPLLAFSDLSVVDDKLNLMDASFIQYHNIKFETAVNIEQLILNNIAPGCVTIVNRKLVETANIEVTDDWIMHDWWFMLVAASFGKINFVNESLMLYRQHGNNVVGSNRDNTLKKIINLSATIEKYKISLCERKKQADRLLLLEHLPRMSDKKIRKVLSSKFMLSKYECSKKRKLLALM